MNEPSPLADFDGQARLFPLPNLVFFPHVMQPLHIFEPRYRQMTADALTGDRLIAMAFPRPGWEKDYAANPTIHTIACLGRIDAEQRLEDGRYNILLRGLTRIRILHEESTDKLYRVASAEIVPDLDLDDDAGMRRWRRRLKSRIPKWFAKQTKVVEQLLQLVAGELTLGALADIIAFALPLDTAFKQELLEEAVVQVRLQRLYDFLEESKASSEKSTRTFPPDFSAN